MLRLTIKYLISTIILTIVTMIVIVIALPHILSEATVKKSLQDSAKIILEKDVVINGSVEFSILPEFYFRAKDVVIDDGGQKRRLDYIHLGLDIMPLITNNFQVNFDIAAHKKRLIGTLKFPKMSRLVNNEPSKMQLELYQPVALKFSTDINLADGITRFNNIKLESENTNIAGNMEASKSSIKSDITFSKLEISDLIKLKALGALFANREVSSNPKIRLINGGDNSPWSPAPIDFEWLEKYSQDIKIKANSVSYNGREIGNINASVTVKDGVLNAKLHESELYGGKGVGSLTIRKNQGEIIITKSNDMRNIKLGDLLGDLQISDKLQGKGDFKFNLEMRGNSRSEFIRSLNGDGHIGLKDGFIKGIDVKKLSSLNRGEIFDTLNDPSAKTEILELDGGFKIKNGVLENNDLTIKIPFLQLSGKGEINIPQLRIDYLITPNVGVSNLGLKMPIAIKGSLFNPHIKFDVNNAILKNIDQLGILDSQVIEGIKGDSKEMLKRIGGGLLNKFLER